MVFGDFSTNFEVAKSARNVKDYAKENSLAVIRVILA